ncbi:hypothetical protein [Streptomyces varsoviensis]|uniref:hypothetical protein n=1 Tax=Streptomyces varsoviensis TaxID=67373 RepID=UPI0012FF2ABA|nr:hypothetical protein [Streptomyces varsoviensis]
MIVGLLTLVGVLSTNRFQLKMARDNAKHVKDIEMNAGFTAASRACWMALSEIRSIIADANARLSRVAASSSPDFSEPSLSKQFENKVREHRVVIGRYASELEGILRLLDEVDHCLTSFDQAEIQVRDNPIRQRGMADDAERLSSLAREMRLRMDEWLPRLKKQMGLEI